MVIGCQDTQEQLAVALQAGKTQNQAYQVDKGDWADPPDCWKPPRVKVTTRPFPPMTSVRLAATVSASSWSGPSSSRWSQPRKC